MMGFRLLETKHIFSSTKKSGKVFDDDIKVDFAVWELNIILLILEIGIGTSHRYNSESGIGINSSLSVIISRSASSSSKELIGSGERIILSGKSVKRSRFLLSLI